MTHLQLLLIGTPICGALLGCSSHPVPTAPDVAVVASVPTSAPSTVPMVVPTLATSSTASKAAPVSATIDRSAPANSGNVTASVQQSPEIFTSPLPSLNRGTSAPATNAPAAPSAAASSRLDNVPDVVADVGDIAAQIRSSPDAASAERHAAASTEMAQMLTERSHKDLTKGVFYVTWSSAMHHLANAARYKAASFSAWNDQDAKSKLLNMDAELLAAKGDATSVQRLVAR